MNKKITIPQLLFGVFIFSFNFIPCFAEIKQDEFIIKQKRFVNELYQNKRYFDCIAETQRLLYYTDNKTNQDELIYFINACYFLGKQYKTVISRIDNLKKNTGILSLNNLFLYSRSYLNIGYYDISKKILYSLDYSDVNEDRRSDLFTKRAEFFIKNFDYAILLKEVEIAEGYFTNFGRLFSLTDFRNDIESYKEIGLKSKWLSVSLSALVPGAGQVYSGRLMDGLLSLAAVAGSAYGALYFYNKKDKPPAITFTFFSCLFYAGNLYGAYNSAEDTNNNLHRRFTNRINKKYNLNYNPADYIEGRIFE
ncbi:MAG: hypothetical protein JXN64_04860 [Spirochaetes bacterium]|nr:hypothetical protein [Spirochaetota bacterium]